MKNLLGNELIASGVDLTQGELTPPDIVNSTIAPKGMLAGAGTGAAAGTVVGNTLDSVITKELDNRRARELAAKELADLDINASSKQDAKLDQRLNRSTGEAWEGSKAKTDYETKMKDKITKAIAKKEAPSLWNRVQNMTTGAPLNVTKLSPKQITEIADKLMKKDPTMSKREALQVIARTANAPSSRRGDAVVRDKRKSYDADIKAGRGLGWKRRLAYTLIPALFGTGAGHFTDPYRESNPDWSSELYQQED